MKDYHLVFDDKYNVNLNLKRENNIKIKLKLLF